MWGGNKIKLIGVKNIPIMGDEIIKSNTDYLIALTAQREGVYQPDSQGEEDEPITYTLRVSQYEDIRETVTKKSIKYKKGFTKSQQLRTALEAYFERAGLDNTEENYEKDMDKIINDVDNKEI